MKIKKLNLNTVSCLPYQEPIRKGAIVTDWYVEQAKLKSRKYKTVK